MNWVYSITAKREARLLMRVSQIFDQQMLTPKTLTWSCAESIVQMTVHVLCEESLARRIHAKLWLLEASVDIKLEQLQRDQGEEACGLEAAVAEQTDPAQGRA